MSANDCPQYPLYPLYIPSKSRHESRLTVKALDSQGMNYYVIIEEQQYGDYAKVIDKSKLLVLDKSYQRNYDTFDDLGDSKSKGPGPARNFAWEHSKSNGYEWHWVMDDNICAFSRFNRNRIVRVKSPVFWRVMEDFTERYKNVAMSGPCYETFVKRRTVVPPFIANTRIYSCNLIRNDIPFRWRGRYNEDTDLSLRILKSGYCTIQFNAFLQHKQANQTVKGGNSTEFYDHEGTLPKSRMQVAMHPDVSRIVWKFNRWHHSVDYRPFKKNKLILRDSVVVTDEPNEYGMKLKKIKSA